MIGENNRRNQSNENYIKENENIQMALMIYAMLQQSGRRPRFKSSKVCCFLFAMLKWVRISLETLYIDSIGTDESAREHLNIEINLSESRKYAAVKLFLLRPSANISINNKFSRSAASVVQSCSDQALSPIDNWVSRRTAKWLRNENKNESIKKSKHIRPVETS